MYAKIILFSLAVSVIILTGIGYYLHSTPDVFIEMRSIPQGDLVDDQRTSEEACSTLLTDLQTTDYEGYSCSLSSSERIDTETDYYKCTDGASEAGCFSCIIECRR